MRKSIKKDKKKNINIEYIGWFGVILLLFNYALLSAGFLKGDGAIYHLGALIGSIFIGWEAWSKRDRQPAILNFIFVGVALFALIRIMNLN